MEITINTNGEYTYIYRLSIIKLLFISHYNEFTETINRIEIVMISDNTILEKVIFPYFILIQTS